jgi:hypothetical protein
MSNAALAEITGSSQLETPDGKKLGVCQAF